jgi:poly(hydroxyalkanoate) depolymerase family esterase
MRNISDTMARMAAFQEMSPLGGRGAGTGRLASLDNFGSNPRSLVARYHVPADLPDGAPLVVVLHGCTQTAAVYDHGSGWSTLADRDGFAVLFPEQTRANNPNLCFNWFVPEHTNRDGGEALSIRQMIDAMVLAHDLDRSRIFVTGLSAGGAMTSVMLATYPELFAGGAIIAGLPFGSAKNVPEAFDRMRGHGGPDDAQLTALVKQASGGHDGAWPRISVWHGTADRTVAVSNMDRIVAQWRGLHELGEVPDMVDAIGDHRRSTWHGDDGLAVIEQYRIAGMGHGTPIDPNGPEKLGNAGAHMLDVGLSSTALIAASWGISGASAAQAAPLVARQARAAASWPRPAVRDQAKPKKQAPGAARAGGVQKIIEDALRAAGLMR